MTWENDKNETATQIYSFIADFDEKIYANEERREDSLIQQAAHMQTAFSFVSAALFMVAAIIIDNRGRISLEFLLVAFSSRSFSCRQSGFEKTEDLSEKRFVLESKRLTYKGTICEAAFFKLLIAISTKNEMIHRKIKRRNTNESGQQI